MAGLPSNLGNVQQGPTVLAVGVGWGGLDIFSSSIISLFFSLISQTGAVVEWLERLGYCRRKA